MANTIRIKRRAAGGASGAPSSLWAGELAYNEQDQSLYIGEGTGGAGGTATLIRAIAGPGVYQPLDSDLTAVAGLSTNGLIARTGTGSVSTRTLTAPAAGITVSNGDGVSGNPTLALANDLSALEALSSTGIAVRTGSDTWAQRSVAGTSGRITLTNGDGVSGNPTVDLSSLTIGGSGTGTYTKLTVDTYGRVTSTATATHTDIGAPTADVSWGGYKITSLADPTAAQDAATKAYVDAARSGLDVKQSVRAASTATVTVTYNATNGTSARGQITAAPNTLDGVTLAANDRILLKDQSAGAQNGIWVVTTLGTGSNGVWDRATDFDSDSEVTAGAFTFVTEGTTNADSGWVLTTNDAITIGGSSGTSLAFAQFSGAGQITAGAGLTKTGNTIDAVGTSNRITVNADSIDIASTYVGQTSITNLGTVGTGTWQGSVVGGTYGGTGVNNGSNTITVGGNLSTAGAFSIAGAFAVALTATASTTLTLPTSGTLLSDSSTIDGGTF